MVPADSRVVLRTEVNNRLSAHPARIFSELPLS
jgi:hypothetical protein